MKMYVAQIWIHVFYTIDSVFFENKIIYRRENASDQFSR